MKIKFLGASGTVTGSGYLITNTDNKQYIVDFGMFQGPDEISKLNRLPLEFSPGGISAVFLTHAHLDHSGRIPLLTKHGFKGNFYMTKATSVLAEIVMLDSAKIASFDEDNDPIYSEEDVLNTLDRIKTIDYRKTFKVDSLEVTYRDAGHILGSSFIEIKDIISGKKITFSGDLGNTPELLMKPTESPRPADIVVMESTYGDRNHPPENPNTLLAQEINNIEKENGTLLIPAFSIERTQVLLYMLKNLKKAKLVQNSTPVYLDSPMAIRATKAYRDYCFLFNKEILKDSTHQDPFFFPELHIIRSTKKSRRLKDLTGPKVILAGSGMMNGGRILTHAQTFLPQKNTTVLFVGFQAEQTLGRQIEDGAKEVFIEEKSVKVNAKVSRIESLSSHADQRRLKNWASQTHSKKVFLVHGEDPQRNAFSTLLTQELHTPEVIIPKMNETFDA